ncbi:MAG: gamma-glutamyl-gamma-aminobutyrate hydrolase family protein [Candidatus Taylorbacteria bacterium]|nr:gamma-glutamyl-gamma-aminobutyrate hydrolase family protein [Candidatus Taylorbacteria bacterium]
MKKPLILSYKTLKKTGEVNTKYQEAIEHAGGILQMLESNQDVDTYIDQADGVLLPGGNDVNPMLYGEERKSHTQPPHDERDILEMYLIDKAMERKLPILGICRGLQILNVKLGGTLYQDIEQEMNGGARHDWHEENLQLLPRSLLVHNVSLEGNSKIHSLVGKDTIEVNSLHHQGIKTLGKDLVATGHSPDGLIEAVEMTGYPYAIGVQWHPEELTSISVWKDFLDNFIKVCSK